MKILMICDVCYVNDEGLQWLRNRKMYEISDDWGKLMLQDG